jgi:hypothetical protein
MQLVALEHATPKSSLRCVVGLRVVWIDQAVPLHRSASVTSVLELLNQFPTAVQADPELQATDSSDAPLFAGGFGVVTIDQAIPFQLSARVKGWPDGVLVYDPTAMQEVETLHATPTRVLLLVPAGSGVGWTDQVVPFHRSSSVLLTLAALKESPTAVQAVALVHATAARELITEPSGLGVERIDQALPFHCSARVVTAFEVLIEYPTATQAVGAVHDTPARKVLRAPTGLGVACNAQPDGAAAAMAFPESSIMRTAAAGSIPILRTISCSPCRIPSLAWRRRYSPRRGAARHQRRSLVARNQSGRRTLAHWPSWPKV